MKLYCIPRFVTIFIKRSHQEAQKKRHIKTKQSKAERKKKRMKESFRQEEWQTNNLFSHTYEIRET